MRSDAARAPRTTSPSRSRFDELVIVVEPRARAGGELRTEAVELRARLASERSASTTSSGRARRCRRSSDSSSRSRRARRACSSRARAARARSSWPRRSTSTAPARAGALRQAPLRGARRVAPRERALRPREGRVHRRRGAARGALQAGRRRHALPRRDRRDFPAASRSSCSASSRSARSSASAATRPLKVDVRVIAATNRDLQAEVGEGHVPGGPLLSAQRRHHRAAAAARAAERHPCPGDALPAQVRRRRTARSIEGFADDALERIAGYRWPGNVRELENVIERAVVLCDEAEHRAPSTCRRASARVHARHRPHPGLDASTSSSATRS